MTRALSVVGERFSVTFPWRTTEREDDGGETYVDMIPRSSNSIQTYWRHYKTNPLIRAAVVEAVHSLIGIPLVAEYYSETDKAWLPMPATDRLQRLLRRPSRSMPAAVFWGKQYTDLAVTGNMFMWKQRNDLDGIRQFQRLDPKYTFPIPGEVEEVGGFRYNPNRLIGTGQNALSDLRAGISYASATNYPLEDVVHIPLDPDPDYPLMGLSPIASALKDIDLDNAITEFTTSVMERGAAVDKVLITKQRINDAEARRLERRWLRRRAGPRNAGGLAIIDGTEATLENLGMSLGARDMGLADLRKLVEARVLMAMDVPPIIVGSVVGLENATYSNYNSAKLAFHEENTDPNLWRLCSALEFALTDEFPEHRDKLVRIRPDLSRVMALMQYEESRRRLALAEYNGGLATQTEARASVDRPPLPGGNFYITPLNLARVVPGTEPVPVAGPSPKPEPPQAISGRQMTRLRGSLRDGKTDDLIRELAAVAKSVGISNPVLASRIAWTAAATRDDVAGESLDARTNRISFLAMDLATRHIAENVEDDDD